MRICVVVPSYYPALVYGGPIVSIHSVNKEIASSKVQVFVSTTNANGDRKLEVDTNKYIKFSDNYFVKYYNDTIVGRLSIPFVLSVWRDIKSTDLVRIEDIFSLYIPPALFYAALLKKPMVVSPRGVLSTWSLTNKRPLLKKIWLFLFFKPFLKDLWWHATSSAEAREIKAIDPLARVRVIPNGVDLVGFARERLVDRVGYLKKFDVRNLSSPWVLTAMGRIHEKKGLDILIKSLSRLCEQGLDAVLLIAGRDDGFQVFLEKLIGELCLWDRVYFVGEVVGDCKREFLSGSDLFVLPSHSENFGNVYLEALASGVPIVASSNTPWSGVEDAKCGRCVDNTVDEVSAAIQDMIEVMKDPDVKEQYRQSAVAYANQFSWTAVARSFDEYFTDVAAAQSLRGREH